MPSIALLACVTCDEIMAAATFRGAERRRTTDRCCIENDVRNIIFDVIKQTLVLLYHTVVICSRSHKDNDLDHRSRCVSRVVSETLESERERERVTQSSCSQSVNEQQHTNGGISLLPLGRTGKCDGSSVPSSSTSHVERGRIVLPTITVDSSDA